MMFNRLSEPMLNSIKNTIKQLENILIISKTNALSSEDVSVIQDAIIGINEVLYGISEVYFKKDLQSTDWMIDELYSLIPAWRESIEMRNGTENDVVFGTIYSCIVNFDTELIIKSIIDRFNSYNEETKAMYLTLPKRYTFLKSKLDYKNGDYSIINEHIGMLKDNIETYKWLYHKLLDNRSRAVLNGIIAYWFDFDLTKFHKANEYLYRDYYDLDIIPYRDDYVMVDCGAYSGDSVIDFLNAFGKYKRIYSFELSSKTYGIMKNNLSAFENIICINKALGKEVSVVSIDNNTSAGNNVGRQGDTKVDLTTIDEEINEHIDIIKFDIEGAEQDALIGAKRHILEDKPILLVSSYHRTSDIFEIPLLINSIRDDYKFYMRLNNTGSIWPCDYILIAI